MVSAPVLFDTCILIDYLRGVPQARAECDRRADRAISIITWIEVMAGATPTNRDDTRSFLLNFVPLPLTPEVAENAVAIRIAKKIKLPDAIIQATAEVDGRVLITRNTRDFPVGTAGVHVPYTI
ncbi:MAG TPA: type II toxin-antitoxin system VapC family toxin [Acidobacteriaceae bacterium]|nr:type II toxin-antitoxin system VapC family toxin [Acidobacteriaceae bacterium]